MRRLSAAGTRGRCTVAVVDDASSVRLACTLDADDYRRRLALIADLNRSRLREAELEGRVLRLTYAAEAAERVRDLIRLEQACCAFLRFGVTSEADTITLCDEAPASAGREAGALLAPFLPAR